MILARRPDDFAHRNLFLQALLGIHSFASRFERLARIQAEGALARPDDLAVFAALGVIAAGRRIGAMTARADVHTPTRTPAAPHDLGRVLR
jgi:hypothetical protein